MKNLYLTTDEIKEAFHKVNLEENYSFLEEDLVKLANAFVNKAAPEIAKVEREACIDVARSYNHLVADKIAEVRGDT
jgi:hypothetical protein